MNKIVASVGMVALGASGIQTASAQQSMDISRPAKPWSVSATLRGFYDDNSATLPDNAPLATGQHRSSFGFEVSPSAALNWAVDTTTFNLGILYSMRYYENKPPTSTDHIDQDFTFNLSLTHAFSERYQGSVSDSFVIGQEPDTLRAGNTFATFQRISGDNIRNYGALSFDAQLTPRFGASLGYDNAYYDYAATGASPGGAPDPQNPLSIGSVIASPSGVLDRIENGVHVEGLWAVQPQTKALVGYRFRDVDYTGNEIIGGDIIPGPILVNPVFSKNRDFREQYLYVGGMHNFRPDLNGSLRLGASYTDYYNDSNASASYTPFVEASLRWTYATDSYVEGGFNYDRSATDQVGLLATGGVANFTLDQEAATIFATVNHRITPKVFASLTGQFQNSLYNGGAANNQSEQYYLMGLNLEYRFTPNFAADVGYNYDKLDSSILNRSFDRNRIYIGLTASY
ncbi:MAG TPA: outer membrane beta-barrel protein [Candidatus Binatia bacterium]|jgi:hypothetical protein|nr:outer membrane beta-barrel protein [Candidatus Binatia bacterium]